MNLLVKGASSGGKSFTATRTLELIGPDFVNHLTSSSALSLVYDDRPLAHTVLFITKRTSCRRTRTACLPCLSAPSSVKAGSSTRPRLKTRTIQQVGASNVSCVKARSRSSSPRRESCTPRMKPACCAGISARVMTRQAPLWPAWPPAPPGLSLRQLTLPYGTIFNAGSHLGPDDAVVPFAQQIATAIKPLMVRFRRDVGSLFNFIKASALLHQAQRQVDAQGRVVATVADYAVGLPDFL